jgi:hypothetical protein
VNVIVEDHRNPALLFVGTDTGAWASIDHGDSWTSLKANMPTVPVKDLLVHPTENDLVVATYGRGLYVADVSALQEMNAALLDKESHLFAIEPNVIRRSERQEWGNYHLRGDRHLATDNEPAGLVINYYLKNASSEAAEIAITDTDGNEVARFEGDANAGMNRAHWDTADVEDIGPGRYRVTLESGDQILEQEAELIPPRAFAIGPQSGPLIAPR